MENIKYTNKELNSFFSSIKRDDVVKFEEKINNNPRLISFKNKKRENILFYAFKSGSEKIIDYMLEKYPNLIKEKNILNLNIIHELIINDKPVDLFYKKLNNFSQEEIFNLYRNTDLSGNNLILIAAKYGSDLTIEQIIKNCPNFNDLIKHKNNFGQNIMHLLAGNLLNDNSNILKKIDKQLMLSRDALNGFTPLMIAAYNQNVENFKNFFDLLPEQQKSYIDSQLSHFAAANNQGIIKLLIDKKIFKNEKNKINQSPLGIALSKNKIDIAEEIIKNLGENVIFKEDIVLSAKISSKNKNLFNNIIKSENAEKLTSKEEKVFLEYLFLYGDISNIIELGDNEKYKNLFVELDIKNLIHKTIVGKKDMLNKIDFLLKEKQILDSKEVVAISETFKILPKNQIKWILEKSQILTKIRSEDKSCLFSLCLERNLNINFKEIKLNENEVVQSFLKKTIKHNKLEHDLNSHFKNIKEWLKIIKDKDVVFKHYGTLIAREKMPFDFIKKEYDILNKEDKKKLLYYTITGMFKSSQDFSIDTLEIIKNFKNLTKETFKDILKYNKIPKNIKLIDLIEDKFFMNEDSLITLLKSNKNEETINFLIKYIDFFNINKFPNEKLITSIFNHDFGSKLFSCILKKYPEEKSNFIIQYFKIASDKKINQFKDIFIDKDTLLDDKLKRSIEETFIKTIENPEGVDIKVIEKLWKMTDIRNHEMMSFCQMSINQNKINEVFKIQKAIKKDFCFECLCLEEINWKEVNSSIILEDDKENNVIDFFKFNQDRITSTQKNEIIRGLCKELENGTNLNICLFEDIIALFYKNENKVETTLLSKLVDKIITEYSSKEYNQIMYSDNYNNILNLILYSENKNILKLTYEQNGLPGLSEKNRTFLEKIILEDNLISKKEIFKGKKLKI